MLDFFVEKQKGQLYVLKDDVKVEVVQLYMSCGHSSVTRPDKADRCSLGLGLL